VKTVSAPELAHWLADPARPKPVLLDVREPWEFERCCLQGAALMPMRELPQRFADIDGSAPIVCICHHGGRSAHAAMFLTRQGFGEVYNLTGGVDAWALQVDPTMARY
jgi:rhodanese-related sulfurtransferase